MDYRHTQFGPPVLRFGVLAFLIAIGFTLWSLMLGLLLLILMFAGVVRGVG